MPPPTLVADKIDIFAQLTAVRPANQWLGKRPLNWAASVAPDFELLHLLSPDPLTRHELITLWRDENVSTETCFLSTMAWGGMKRNHGRAIWETRAAWLPVCRDIRRGQYRRQQAFHQFRNLREQGSLPGMGPAYFTKILFFAMPSQDAYILDQWTARSMHLLTNDRGWLPVQIDPASRAKAHSTGGSHRDIRVTVTDRFGAGVYEQYCVLVEQLACLLKLIPCDVEERMFGIGGRAPSGWREYVMTNWYDLAP